MLNTVDTSAQSGLLEDQDASYSLGFKEFIFLTFIFFFGFCGFTVCVDKLYNQDQNEKKIQSVTRHDDNLSATTPAVHTYYAANYTVN
jgi:hypothetical protein